MSLALSQLRWPSLAQDLAVMAVPGSPITELDEIYATYKITEAELKELLRIPHFQQLLKNSLAHFQAQGNKAGQIFRAATLGQALSEKLFHDAMNGELEAKDTIKLLELLYRAAGTFDNKDNPAAQVNTQINVGVSLPVPRGLKNQKLKHLDTEAAHA